MKTDGSTVTIVGRVATNPTVSTSNGVDRVTLRVVSTERRFEDGVWVDGDEFGANVVCWRTVAAGVLKLVRKGDPLIVTGRISTRKFERNGATEYYTDIRADLVAFDLAKGKDRIRRSEAEPASSVEPEPSSAGVDEIDLTDLQDCAPALAGVG